jgi:hypothetical protein
MTPFLFLSAALAAEPTVAEDVAAELPAPTLDVRARPTTPSVAIRATPVGLPDLIGVDVAVFAPRPVVIEAGVSTALVAVSAYARVGVAVPLIGGDEPRESGSFALFAEPMVGWRTTNVWGRVGSGPNGVVALDAVLWATPRVGFDLQLAGGASMFGAGEVIPDVRLAGGVVF